MEASHQRLPWPLPDFASRWLSCLETNATTPDATATRKTTGSNGAATSCDATQEFCCLFLMFILFGFPRHPKSFKYPVRIGAEGTLKSRKHLRRCLEMLYWIFFGCSVKWSHTHLMYGIYIYILNIQTTAEKVSGPPSSIPKIYPNTKPQDIWMSRDINIGMPGDSKWPFHPLFGGQLTLEGLT